MTTLIVDFNKGVSRRSGSGLGRTDPRKSVMSDPVEYCRMMLDVYGRELTAREMTAFLFEQGVGYGTARNQVYIWRRKNLKSEQSQSVRAGLQAELKAIWADTEAKVKAKSDLKAD